MATPRNALPDHLKRVLALDPSAGAIEFDGRWHSWGELAALSNALVARLEEAGLEEGAPVGLLLRNDPAMVAAALGVIVSRRCVVTLNPHQGAERLARELQELRLPAIVGTPIEWERSEIAEPVRAAGSLGLSVDAAIPLDTGAVEDGGGLRVIVGRSQDDSDPSHPREVLGNLPGIAVQMLTSGTTGAPKRVDLSLRAIEHSLLGAKHYEKGKETTLRLRSGVAIISGPLVHVGGLWRVLQCLADGRPFALLERFEVGPWCELVRRHRPRTASLVPTALRMVLEANVEKSDLESLLAVVSGTAPLPPEQAEEFESRFGVPVLTAYGATEFAGGVAGWNLSDHREYRDRKRGSVGRAHPGCLLRVVDPDSGRVLPAGEQGLLEVQSEQIGPGTDWVRTTDLAAIDDDGFLFIRGRADAAIIRGGFKILPDEVKAVLETHPAVREAAVVGLDDARLGQLPVAALTIRAGVATPSEDELREYAKRHLANYQVPARILLVDELPRTPSLKVSQPEVVALFDDAPDQPGRRA